MSFDTLKSKRKTSLEELAKEAEKLQSNNQRKDDSDEYWSPTIDKAGNGYAVIRFLPAAEGEPTPWVRYWDHGFQGPTGKWYIEKSLTTLDQDDPVSVANSKLWNSGIEDDKAIVRDRKRRLHYDVAILVISDPSKPEMNGQVKKFKIGKKIFEKITGAMKPQFEDEEPIDPFSFWEGANFKLKIRKVDGYRNYDKSEFDKKSELFDGDEDKLRALYGIIPKLSTIIDPKSFKSYAELERKFLAVIGETAPTSNLPTQEPRARQEVAASEPVASEEPDIPAWEDDDDGDATLKYFEDLTRK